MRELADGENGTNATDENPAEVSPAHAFRAECCTYHTCCERRGISGDGGEGERTAQISGEKRGEGGGAAKP